MSNILIATPEISDAGTVSASSSAAAGPAANLLLMQPTDLWQSTDLAPYLEIDLGTVKDFDLIALLFTNMTAAAQWRVRTANSQANLTASPTYDSGVVTFCPWSTEQDRRHGFVFNSAGWSNQWVRIDLADPTNPEGVISAGRLYVADSYLPSFNYVALDVGFIDTSTRARTTAGNTIPNRQGIIPTLSFDIDLDDEQEFYAGTIAIQRRRGAARDVLAIIDPDDAVLAHDMIHYGLLNPTMRSVRRSKRSFIQRYELEGLI